MILARIKLLGLSSESDKTLQVKMHDVCILDTRELSVELSPGFHEKARRENGECRAPQDQIEIVEFQFFP
jgi:hypothetical protein